MLKLKKQYSYYYHSTAGGVVYTNFGGNTIEKRSEKIKPDAHKRQVLWSF